MTGLDGKVALVTGASRGIGAATARALAAGGASVAIHFGRSAAEAEALAADLPEDRRRLVQADLAAPAGPAALWAESVDWKGGIDVLVNNAGIFTPAEIEGDEAAWERVWAETLQVNLKAAADLCRLAIGHFRGRGGGIIVNVASRAAFRGDTPDYMAYAASKGGMVALSRTIARGYAAENVLSYVVAPGFVRTDMAEDFIAVHGEAAAADDIPMGELAPPEEVAEVIAFLASGKARHATGATIDVNGASYVR